MLGNARDRARTAVCLANLRQLQLAWIMYADDWDGAITSASAPRPSPAYTYWVTVPNWGVTDKATWDADIQTGTFWPYVKDLQAYRCPTVRDNVPTSYDITEHMNGWYDGNLGCAEPSGGCPASGSSTLLNISQIGTPTGTMVYLCRGSFSSAAWGNGGWGAWICSSGGGISYADQMPNQHNGLTLSFVDGHSEYWAGGVADPCFNAMVLRYGAAYCPSAGSCPANCLCPTTNGTIACKLIKAYFGKENLDANGRTAYCQ
jgi:hypothetical protein